LFHYGHLLLAGQDWPRPILSFPEVHERQNLGDGR
jgi:hypothetical protein